MDEGTLLLLVGAVLAASIAVGLGASRAGVPVLVAFLALGMLLGSDGIGRIEFDDAELGRKVGVVCLVAILYEGGLSTSRRRLRNVAVPAALLSTIGVVITAILTGGAAHTFFDLDWPQSVLLGSVVASTDAAAVFATLRHTQVRRRLARTLECETGLNRRPGGLPNPPGHGRAPPPGRDARSARRAQRPQSRCTHRRTDPLDRR